jgi:electron transfer flavoprotein alpha/beta subunit
MEFALFRKESSTPIFVSPFKKDAIEQALEWSRKEGVEVYVFQRVGSAKPSASRWEDE